MKALLTLVVLLIILTQIRLPAQYATAVLSDNPVAYWRLDDTDGSRVVDSSGNNHHGAADGDAGSIAFVKPGLLATETANGSISLAGFDRIVVPGFEKIGEQGYSAEYWVRVTKYPEACCDSLVSDGEAGGDFFMMNYLLGPGQGDNGGIRPHFSFANAPVALSTSGEDVLALDTVYHVVTTWDATDPDNGNGKVYVNGEVVLEDNVTGVVPPAGDTGDNAIFIGRDNRENRPSNFDIDEVALYDYPLSSERIAAHFEAAGGPARTPTGYEAVVLDDGPIAYWRMDDADGSKVADASGNGHDGAVDGDTGSVAFGQSSLLPAESEGGSVSLAGLDRIVVPGFEKIGDRGYSAEYWVRVTTYPEECCDSLVSDGEAGGDFFMMNYLLGPGQGDNGGIRPHFSFANTPVALSTAGENVLALDEVYHVVTTWDATDPDNNNGKVYINGIAVLEGNVSGNVPAAGETGDNMIFIGRDNRENRPSNFDIDEVALYDFPLTKEQVEAHFEAGSGLIIDPGGNVVDENDLRSIPDGMIHYWTFNEGVGEPGTTTFDRAGTADGNFEGNAAFELLDGAVGGSFLAVDNSAGSGVNVGTEGFEDTAEGITVEAVIFPLWSGEVGDYDEIFRKEDGGNRILFSFQNDSFGGGANPAVDPGPVLSFGLDVGGYGELDMPLDGSNKAGVTLESLKDGQFHHVAATYDTASGEKTIWIDGVLAWSVNLTAGTAPVTGGGATAYIGNTLGGGEPFTGGIDEVAVWNRALTAEEIAMHSQNVANGKRNPYLPPPVVGKSDYSEAVLADNPVAYWRLGEASAGLGEAVDATGNGNTGFAEDGTLEFVKDSLVPPDADGGVSLNGDRFLVEPFDKIDTGFTVELWAQIDSATGRFANLVGDGDGGLNFMLMLYMTPSGNVRPHVQTDAGFGSLDSVRRIDDGILHHIVSTWDEASGEMILYIDGVPAETRVTAGNIPTTGSAINDETNPIFIGRDNREQGWNGLIDEVAIYNYALSPERVKAHFDLVDTPAPPADENLPDPGDLAGAPEGMTHLYDFNEANRKRDGLTLNFAYDRIGSADGAFEGMAGRTDGLLGRGAATFANSAGDAVNVGADGFSTTTGITLAAVIRPDWSGDAGDYDEIFRKEDGGNRILFSFQNDSFGGGANPAVDPGPVLSFGLNVGGYGELDMPLSGDDAPVTLDQLKDGNPHLVVATYDSTTGEKAIWVDGVKAWNVMLTAGTEIVSGGGAAATIGNVAPGGGEPFTGIIDEFGFWDRAVTAEEIAGFYESVMGGRAQPYFPKPQVEGGYAETVLQDNPVGYWRLDDAGPIAADLSGSGNDGEDRAGNAIEWGVPSLLAFDPNAAANMNGEGVLVPEFEKIGPNGFAVEFIMQIEEGELGGFKNLVGDGVGGLNFMLMVYLTGGGNIRGHVQTTDGFYCMDTVESYADGLPHHVVSEWDARTGEMVLYVDGNVVEVTATHGSFPTTGEAINTGNPLYIGRDDREGGFIGVLDEVAVYDHALGADRVALHHGAMISEGEPVVPGEGSAFAITEVVFDAASKDLTLTWDSTENASYIVEISSNLETWLEAIDSIASMGGSTSITENIGAFLPADAAQAYVRVKLAQ